MPHIGETLQPTRGTIQTITVGASPFTYTASGNGTVIVNSGTVSIIAFVRDGTVVGTGVTAGMFPVSIGDGIRVTYSVAPNVRFVPT
jgi:hypothetical protein